MTVLIERFRHDETGATAIEYGLIAALICIAIIASMNALGSSLSATWDKVAQNVAVK